MNREETNRLMLRYLSEDSRSTITKLSSVLNCSRPTVMKILEYLERNADLRYTLELDLSKKIPLERHLITVKFAVKPNAYDISELIKKDEYIHNAYATEGDFDLVLHAISRDPLEYIRWENRIVTELSQYKPVFKPSELIMTHFGFLPFNNGVKDILKGIIKEKDNMLIEELNKNSRTSYAELSKLTGIDEETIRYRLFKLRESGIIKRFTTCVQKPRYPYNIMFFANYRFNKETAKHAEMARNSYIKAKAENELGSNYQLLAPLSGSYRFFAMANFESKEDAMKNAIRRHKFIFESENVEIKHARITSVMKGMMPYRNLDIQRNYTRIDW